MEKVMDTKEATLPDGKKIKLEYILLEREEKNEKIRYYGMAIRKSCNDFTEEERLDAVTESLEKATRWLERLARNLVTPMCLIEVTDDMVTQDGIE